MNKSPYSRAWKIAYTFYPPLLRVLERLGFHKGRQNYPIGFLDHTKHSPDTFRTHLETLGFEHAILAWKDSYEILSMRKVDQHKYQWHIRLHSDGEVRGHYEYSSEGNPVGHIMETVFNDEREHFQTILKDYLI